MCRLLSSLVPGFEGHSVYVHGLGRNGKERINVVCRVGELQWLGYAEKDIICPAWQVEDLLRNWDKIMPVAQGRNSVVDSQMNMMRHQFANRIVSEFLYNPNTAYQKIEEYL